MQNIIKERKKEYVTNIIRSKRYDIDIKNVVAIYEVESDRESPYINSEIKHHFVVVEVNRMPEIARFNTEQRCYSDGKNYVITCYQQHEMEIMIKKSIVWAVSCINLPEERKILEKMTLPIYRVNIPEVKMRTLGIVWHQWTQFKSVYKIKNNKGEYTMTKEALNMALRLKLRAQQGIELLTYGEIRTFNSTMEEREELESILISEKEEKRITTKELEKTFFKEKVIAILEQVKRFEEEELPPNICPNPPSTKAKNKSLIKPSIETFMDWYLSEKKRGPAYDINNLYRYFGIDIKYPIYNSPSIQHFIRDEYLGHNYNVPNLLNQLAYKMAISLVAEKTYHNNVNILSYVPDSTEITVFQPPQPLRTKRSDRKKKDKSSFQNDYYIYEIDPIREFNFYWSLFYYQGEWVVVSSHASVTNHPDYILKQDCTEDECNYLKFNYVPFLIGSYDGDLLNPTSTSFWKLFALNKLQKPKNRHLTYSFKCLIRDDCPFPKLILTTLFNQKTLQCEDLYHFDHGFPMRTPWHNDGIRFVEDMNLAQTSYLFEKKKDPGVQYKIVSLLHHAMMNLDQQNRRVTLKHEMIYENVRTIVQFHPNIDAYKERLSYDTTIYKQLLIEKQIKKHRLEFLLKETERIFNETSLKPLTKKKLSIHLKNHPLASSIMQLYADSIGIKFPLTIDVVTKYYLSLTSPKTRNNFLKQLEMLEKKNNSFAESVRYLVIIDLEATCDGPKQRIKLFNQEIIEFPFIIYSVDKDEIMLKKQYFVKPKWNPILSTFCHQLTKIPQESILKAELLEMVLPKIDEDIKKTVGSSSFAVLTDGDWDMRHCLFRETKQKKIPLPSYFCQYFNLKKLIKKHYPSIPTKSLRKLCQHLNVPIHGHHHSGIDDCHTILNLVRKIKSDHPSLMLKTPEFIDPSTYNPFEDPSYLEFNNAYIKGDPDWPCSRCYVHNKDDSYICFKCNKKRPFDYSKKQIDHRMSLQVPAFQDVHWSRRFLKRLLRFVKALILSGGFGWAMVRLEHRHRYKWIAISLLMFIVGYVSDWPKLNGSSINLVFPTSL